MNKGVPVGPGARVRLRFELRLASGEEVDSTGGKAAEFVVGDGNLPAAFEHAMFGMRAGDRDVFRIESGHGFGPHNADNVQRVPRSRFADMELQEGLIVSFADKQQAELPGVIAEIGEDLVEVDFNHPLAGKDLDFEVEIFAVEQVSNEIVRSA
jgi:FKBP-type peptidyl-prolyl cis-trans isomerase SlpA